MEDTDEFKWAVKVVIKRQMRDLMTQLQENGEEIAIMSVNLDDESCSLYGSTTGEWFLSEQKNLSASFLNFCKSKAKKNGTDTPSSDKGYYKFDFSQIPTSGQKKYMGSVQKSDGTSQMKKSTTGRKPRHLVKEPDPEFVNVVIPTTLAPNCTEEELAALVGRLLASKVVAGKIIDEQGSKFDDMLAAVNLKGMKVDSKIPVSAPSSPSRKKVKLNTEESAHKSTTRSGRKVSAKFLEGLNSLKKVRAAVAAASQTENRQANQGSVEEENAEEKVEDEFNLMKEILDLDPAALRRFHVSTRDGDKVNVLSVAFVNVAEAEEVAAHLIEALDKAVNSAALLDLKKVQLIVTKEEMANPRIKILFGDDLDFYIDEKFENTVSEDENDGYNSLYDMEDEDSDLDLDADDMKVVETSSTPQQAKSVSLGRCGKRTLMRGLKRRPKKRAATELMLMKCEVCGISVTGRSNLKSHYRRIHLHVRNYNCNICGKGFWSNNARESHMLAVHTRKCESCQEYVVESVPWGKGVDMKTKRDVICTCGSIVSIYSIFGRRRVYLRDDEPDEDGNIRESKSKSNSGTKYACGTCGKLFMKKSNCERHSRAHTEMKLCVCDICGNSYTYESSLKKHMQTEHGIVKHVCELCGGNYSNLTALKVHMVKAHHNVAIGENVAIVVQTKGEIDEDLEEFEEALQAKEMENQQQQTSVQKDQSFVVGRDNSSQGRVFIQTPSGEQVLVNTSEAGVIQESGEEGMAKTAQIHVQEEEMAVGENSQQVVISTESGEGVSQEATAQIVEEALRSGQIVAQEGGMSIIIKQVQVESNDLS